MNKNNKPLTKQSKKKRKQTATKKKRVRKKRNRVPKKPVREKVFQIYCFWKSLPLPFFRNKDGSVWSKAQLESIGLNDPLVVELAQLKTQKDFAERFSVDVATLSLWNRTIISQGLHFQYQRWLKELTPQVLAAMFKSATSQSRISHNDRELFLSYVEGYKKESKVEHELSNSLAGLLKRVDEQDTE